jgi:hypothetical protein
LSSANATVRDEINSTAPVQISRIALLLNGI